MRTFTPLLFVLLVGCAHPPESTAPRWAQLPRAWRPSPGLQAQLDDRPWTEAETRLAADAALAGVEEMVSWFEREPEVAEELAGNAIEALLDATYGEPADSTLTRRATPMARSLLERVTRPMLQAAGSERPGEEHADLVAYCAYAHQLMGPHHPLSRQLVGRANAALRLAPSIDAQLGKPWRAALSAEHIPNQEAYDLLLWAVVLLDGATVPGLVLPAESEDFLPATWEMLAAYPLVGARAYPEGANDWTFYDTAYLATHIGYVPTGYGRHALRVADSPSLHRFLRENFYATLEMGELDLVAEFVDLFRQYGGDERSDVMIRDGTRHLLRLRKEAGTWLAHRESYETDEVTPYDRLHKPWTAVAGVRRREPQPPIPGSYGAAFRRLCRPPR